MRRLALVVVVGLALAGCGGGHEGSTSTTNSTAADQAQIKSAYQKFFSGKTSVSDRVALLQNGSRFKALVTSFANNPLAKNVSAKVSSVILQGANKAKVVYIVKLGGAALPKQTGTAVRQNGTWKVGSASLCKLVALAGQHSVRLQVVTSSRVSSVALFRQRHAREAALAAVCAILFLTFLDNTIVSVALANIQSSLSVSVPGLQWIVNGYMLAFAALMLTGGTLGDLFGRKKVMLGGVAIFCAGAVMAAVAPGSGILIAGRIVMGVGAAASEPGTLSVLRHIYPEREERARRPRRLGRGLGPRARARSRARRRARRGRGRLAEHLLVQPRPRRAVLRRRRRHAHREQRPGGPAARRAGPGDRRLGDPRGDVRRDRGREPAATGRGGSSCCSLWRPCSSSRSWRSSGARRTRC